MTLSDPAGAALTRGSVTVPVAGVGTGNVLTVPLTGVAPVGNVARADVVLG